MRKLTTALLILSLGIFLGWFSARLMLDGAAGPTNETGGGWREVKLGGNGLWSFYQSGHYLWLGKLPPPENSLLYRRDSDDEGNALRADCATVIEGSVPDARWWMLSADNGNESRSLSAGTIIREPDGTFAVTVSDNAMPGNWLRLNGSRSYVLYLTLDVDKADLADQPQLPKVRRLWC